MASFPGPGDEFGRFRVVGVLGRGGMGMVFEAVDPVLDRSVALKVLLPSYSDDEAFRERFRSEAAVLARLDSPHVVQIHEYGEIDGCLFIATQLVRGTDLERQLAESGPLEPDVAADVLAQLCEGLDDAHRVGVVHRDIKPSNVLLHERAGGLYVHLCDFGIALTDASTRTRSGVLVGSVPYLSPECHEGARADARSDVYAVGCLLYQAVTGRPPFEGTDVQVALAHMRQPVPRLTAPGTEHLDEVVQRATAKEPDERFGSAAEMRESLLTALDPDSAAAPRRRGDTRARTRALPSSRGRRRRLPVALLAGVVLLVVAAVAVALAVRSQDPDGGTAGQPAGDGLEAVELTAGSAQTCAVDSQALASCWGWNEFGQLGDETTENRTTPVRVPGEGWKALSTGYSETCGVRNDGTAACWGAGATTPDELPGDEWESVVVRQIHSCGLRGDGSIWCWGDNESGQLGDGTSSLRSSPQRMPGDDWTQVAVGQSHTCGLQADDTLWCWGGNDFGQLGDGTTERTAVPDTGAGRGVDRRVHPRRSHVRGARRRDRVVLGAQRGRSARRRDHRTAGAARRGAGRELEGAAHRRQQHLRAPERPDDLVLGEQRLRPAR